MKKIPMMVVFAFYKYYQGGKHTRSVAYVSAIVLLALCVFVNLLSFMYLLYRTSFLPIDPMEPRGITSLKLGIFYMLPAYFLLSKFFKKEKLVEMETVAGIIDQANILAVCYLVLTAVVFLFS
jgi:hypothetical protein